MYGEHFAQYLGIRVIVSCCFTNFRNEYLEFLCTNALLLTKDY
jgi:hypothetical protein